VELAEQLVELAEVFMDAAADIAGRMELKAQIEIRQPEELKVFNSLRLSVVLLLAVRC
jgi:hypothetical protein